MQTEILVEWKVPYQFSNASDQLNRNPLKTVFVAVIGFCYHFEMLVK